MKQETQTEERLQATQTHLKLKQQDQPRGNNAFKQQRTLERAPTLATIHMVRPYYVQLHF